MFHKKTIRDINVKDQTVLVRADYNVPMEDGKITGVQLYPVTLGQEKKRSQKGRPVMNKSVETLQYLAKLSEPYGTKIDIVDGVGYIHF